MPEKETKPNFIVSFFLKLANSKKYSDIKSLVKDLLHNPDNKYKKFIDYFLIFLIVTSVAIFIDEVKHKIPFWLEIYAVYFTSAVFAIEYLLNLWIYNDIHTDIAKEYYESNFLGRKSNYYKILMKSLGDKLSYVVTPIAIIDLLAILPAYRSLRILKIFVLFRFLKLFKHAKSIHQFFEVLTERKFELITLFALLVFVVFIGGIAIYIAEEQHNNKINGLFDALYWSFITITTVGYGDISPATDIGRVISFVIVILGITMISFATSVIVSAFSEKLNELKEERVAEQLKSSNEFLVICGYGQIAKVFLRSFVNENKKYIVLDVNKNRVQEALNDGHDAICDNASRYEVMKRFYNENAKIKVLALTGSDIENIYISLNAKSVSKNIEVIARATSYKLYSKYIRAGADRVVLPNEIASSMLVSSIVHPGMYKAINAILHSKDVATLDEIYISIDCNLIDKSIKEADFNRYKLVIFGVQNGIKGEFKFNPKPEYKFQENDIVIVMGHKISIEYFKTTVNAGSYR